MALSSTSAGSLASASRPPRGRPRLLLGGLVVAAAGVGAVWVARPSPQPAPPSVPVQVVERWVAAWNARDAQAVSDLTCQYVPAFVAAGDVQHRLEQLTEAGPVVGDLQVTGEHPDVVYDREGTTVSVTYRPNGGGPRRSEDLFVRDAPGQGPCIGYYVTW
jgi:hypothetical protein